jgi:hypothetical protein
VERNALRANLAARAQDWLWSSAAKRRAGLPELDPGPVERSPQWLRYVNQPQTETEVKRMRLSIQRGRPYGEARWMLKAADRMGLESSLRPRGRPRKPLRVIKYAVPFFPRGNHHAQMKTRAMTSTAKISAMPSSGDWSSSRTYGSRGSNMAHLRDHRALNDFR